MIVRSSSTPARPATRNAAGMATRIDDADVVRHQQLHDVGGVGAEHHQLAVRHVDDAHDAEGDGQADGDQHQHRAEAQAEEQRLDARVEAAPASRCAARRRRRPRGPSASASTKRAVGGRLDQRRQPVAHLRAAGGCDSVATAREPRRRVAAVERGQRQAGLDLVLDARRRSRRRRAARSSVDASASSSDRSISVTAASRTAGSGSASAKRATRRSQHAPQPVVGADPGQLVRRAPSRRRLERDRIDAARRRRGSSSADLTMTTLLIARAGRTGGPRAAR